jgi:hypothetical protein
MPENLGVFLLFIVFVVFNLIAGAVNRRRQRAAQTAEAPPPRPPRPAPVPELIRVMLPQSYREEAASEPAIVRTPLVRRPPARRRPRLSLRPGELRRAIVLMTVLGPPRALEHEQKEGGGGR